ncbi:MAG: polyhydroxyalkanoate synthesis repressor PhaR [Beijerinckiaceae bacterium]
MADDTQPVTIKKYANRRLYNTGSSSYVTLEDLAEMVKKGEDFVVSDAKSGEDITRSVLTQIIFEQEAKEGQSLLPISFLRQLIRFYGDSMQMLVPSYLEYSIDKLSADQQKFRDQIGQVLGGGDQPHKLIGAIEEQTRKNMAMFTQALSMFNPFAAQAMQSGKPADSEGAPAGAAQPKQEAAAESPLDDMRKQLEDMQRKLEALTRRS